MNEERSQKNIEKLTHAIDKTYGSAWSIVWRNFLAGLVRALGATIGYVLFIGIAVIVAQKLGVFDAVQNFTRSLMENLPFGGSGDADIPLDPELLEQLFKGNFPTQ